MIINYPISEAEAKHFLKMEIGEMDDEILNKILRFFEVNVIDFKGKIAEIRDYISREEIEDKISDIAYDVVSDIEWDLKDSIKRSIVDAFR